MHTWVLEISSEASVCSTKPPAPTRIRQCWQSWRARTVRPTDPAEGQRLYDRLLRSREIRPIPAVNLAKCAANLEHTDDAFRWLRIAVDERCVEVIGLKTERNFDCIRRDPRFEQLVASVGLNVI
jgi:hypothetical protein